MDVETVLLAAPRGFCAGVEMAIKALAWMVRAFEPPVYCYHEIVHNQRVVDRFIDLGVMVYLLFFLLRDGDRLFDRIKTAIPLRAEQQTALFSKFTAVVRATVKGDILVSMVQGALGGLIFWFLGISAPLLWAVLMAFLSLLPAVGAALVWLPVAVYLLATGAVWKSMVLIASWL